MIDSKRIAKNTIFLYARLLLVLGITLYTSRVVLDKLGVDDYALYNVVFSVIGLLSFLNVTLSSGTSRFITFALGKGNINELKKTFSTALCTHLFLAGIILALGETIGIWYVYNVMVCPTDRFQAAFIVYQISILVTIISILQVPFSSEIMAHEKMDFYAYIGIYEAVAKLAIVYMLNISSIDKMVLYGSLICVVQLSCLILNVWYAKKHFVEVGWSFQFDKSLLISILKFSGWNVLANISKTLMSQGVIMLFNIFFLPVVVAAQSISNQISNAMLQLVNNVRQAVNPQVIKLYADQKYEESKRLTLVSAEYVFDLLLLFGIPLIMIMPNLLDVWLVEVPDYAVEFARLILIQDILGNFSVAFYTPMLAANKIEKNSIIASLLCVVQFGLLYILFKCGFEPIWARYISLLFSVIWSFVLKPYILWKDINYNWKEMFICIGRCMRMLLISGIICYFIFYLIPQNTFGQSVIVALMACVVVCVCSFVFMDSSIRKKVICFALNKISQ